MIKDLLPIGSIVLLTGGTKKLMIFGIKQLNDGDENQEFDYSGVPYPEGNVGIESQYLFNHNDIASVFFRGYEDKERETFITALEKLYISMKKT